MRYYSTAIIQIILLLATIVSFGLSYYYVNDTFLSSLFLNVFGGLSTGTIITFLFNIFKDNKNKIKTEIENIINSFEKIAIPKIDMIPWEEYYIEEELRYYGDFEECEYYAKQIQNSICYFNKVSTVLENVKSCFSVKQCRKLKLDELIHKVQSSKDNLDMLVFDDYWIMPTLWTKDESGYSYPVHYDNEEYANLLNEKFEISYDGPLLCVKDNKNNIINKEDYLAILQEIRVIVDEIKIFNQDLKKTICTHKKRINNFK